MFDKAGVQRELVVSPLRMSRLDPRQNLAGIFSRPVFGRSALRATAIGLALMGWPILTTVPVRSEVAEPTFHAPQQLPSLTMETHGFSPPLGIAADYLPTSAIADTYLLLRLSERTLYLYSHETVLNKFPVAVGRDGWETPTGRFTVFEMQQNPVWEHPFTGELIPPGDNNPLGHRWIGFWSDGTNAIGFHGTPQESSIGQAVSHGCVRLYNQDVVTLYNQVAIGTPVYVMP